MPATKPLPLRRRAAFQHGGHLVEFALVAGVFLLLVFGIVEFARMFYVFNTVQEVTRRAANAAIHANFRDQDRLQRIREQAVLRDSPGALPLGAPVTDRHVRIEFLADPGAGSGFDALRAIPAGQLPACPLRNRHVCMANPRAANCIRFVRASVCDPLEQARCEQARMGLVIPALAFSVAVPRATTILPVESLGYWPGMGDCPP